MPPKSKKADAQGGASNRQLSLLNSVAQVILDYLQKQNRPYSAGT